MIDAASRHRARFMSRLGRPRVALATHFVLIAVLLALATLPGEAMEMVRRSLGLNAATAFFFGGIMAAALAAWRLRGWRVPWFVDAFGMIYATAVFVSHAMGHSIEAGSSAFTALTLLALTSGLFVLALLTVPTPWESRRLQRV